MNESQARVLRDRVYGPCSDKNWEACKEHWLKPDAIEWLKNRKENKNENT